MFENVSLNIKKNTSCQSVNGFGGFSNTFNAIQMNPFSFSSGGIDFLNCFNGDFNSTMMLFNSFLNNKMPTFVQDQIFTKDFDTKTNLETLKNVYNPGLSNKLACIADKNANRINTSGWCYRAVKDTLAKSNLNNGEITGGSAKDASRVLSNHKNFKEVKVSRKDLKSLPAGCIIVWQESPGHPHGHIAITLGKGKEASDKVRKVIVRNDAEYSVYVPVGINKKS